jgi:hypothetical protein
VKAPYKYTSYNGGKEIMKDIFTLESGVITTTPDTELFFKEVKEFYLTVLVAKDGTKCAVIESVKDPNRCWYSSAIQEFVDPHTGYIKIVTRNTILQLWSNTYCSKIYNVAKPISQWHEYKWTINYSTTNLYCIMEEKVDLRYNTILNEFQIENSNGLIFITKDLEEAHEIVRLFVMADIFCRELRYEIVWDENHWSEDEQHCMTLEKKKKDIRFTLLIKHRHLYITFNHGASLLEVDRTQTVDEEVERFLRYIKGNLIKAQNK